MKRSRSRIIGSPQLLEVLLVMNGMDKQLNDDGGWKMLAANDE